MSILFSHESQIEAKCIIQARNAGGKIWHSAFSGQLSAYRKAVNSDKQIFFF